MQITRNYYKSPQTTTNHQITIKYQVKSHAYAVNHLNQLSCAIMV